MRLPWKKKAPSFDLFWTVDGGELGERKVKITVTGYDDLPLLAVRALIEVGSLRYILDIARKLDVEIPLSVLNYLGYYETEDDEDY